MSLQQEVIIRDGKIVGSPPIATPSVNKVLVTDGNGNIVGSAVSKNTLEELNMLITDNTGQDIVDGLTALINAVKPNASNIPYDSNLSVKGKIDDINNNLNNLFQTKTYSVSYTAGGNASVTITADDFNASTPSGYTPIGVVEFASQSVNVTVRGIYSKATGSSTMMTLRNVTSTSSTATAYITILYAKSLFI